MNFRLSVIIPTYKRTESLRRLLCLLKQQTIEKDIEIIVVDQNEKDYLYKEIGPSILVDVQHIFQAEPNVSSARNSGAKHSNGNILLFLDDDVIIEPDFCEKGILLLNNNKNIKILSPTLLRSDEKAQDVLPKKITSDLFALSLKDKYLHATFFTISACTFYNRDTFLRSGGFDPYLFRFAKTAEDQEFFIRLIKTNFAVYLSKTISAIIDENVAGGCDLRTQDFWITREKCIKAWVYRYRVHNHNFGKLNIQDIAALCRHTFLNSSILRISLKNTIRQIKILKNAIYESKLFMGPLISNILVNRDMNYINNHYAN